jgi:AbrB family looped-hinge helix DNA binding protein
MSKTKQEGYICTVKLGPKGQIVIPKEVRDMFGIGPGDSLVLMAHPKRGIGLQRQNLMLKIADKILDGQGQDVYPGESDENLDHFANQILKEVQDGCN